MVTIFNNNLYCLYWPNHVELLNVNYSVLAAHLIAKCWVFGQYFDVVPFHLRPCSLFSFLVMTLCLALQFIELSNVSLFGAGTTQNAIIFHSHQVTPFHSINIHFCHIL
jgi:hypothetical protein